MSRTSKCFPGQFLWAIRQSLICWVALANLHVSFCVAVHMCGFDGVRRGNYLGGEPIRRIKVEVKVGKLKNGEVAGKDEVAGEMMKGGRERVVNWIWRMCNMAFESGAVPEDQRSALIVPLYKCKGEGTHCSNYRGISLLSEVGKIYAGILVDQVHKVTEGLIDDEQEGFREGRGCVDQIFTLKQIGENAQETAKQIKGRSH